MNSHEKRIADLQEYQKRSQERIDAMWDEVDRRRRRVGIIILSVWVTAMGLIYYLTQ